jgi:lipopolysaccharide biosynthesis protein
MESNSIRESIILNKVKVLIYLYDTNIWNEYKNLLLNLKDYISIDLALCIDNIQNNNSEIEQECSSLFSDSSIRYVNNTGVDIGPFLLQLKDLDSNKYPYFIKLHSKKSLWGQFSNINWRSFLINALIGSPKIFFDCYNKISSENIGMIGSHGLILGRDKEHTNSKLIEYLLQNILGVKYDTTELDEKCKFIGGTIFMSKTAIFKKYFSNGTIDFVYNILPSNNISDLYNGSIPHSLERIFGYIIGIENQDIIGSETPNIKILGVDNKFYNLVTTYANTAYIIDKPTMAATILNKSDDSLMLNWLHTSFNGIIRKYKLSNDYYSAILETN